MWDCGQDVNGLNNRLYWELNLFDNDNDGQTEVLPWLQQPPSWGWRKCPGFSLTSRCPCWILSLTIKDLKIENYSLCIRCCYLVFSSLCGPNCTGHGPTQIVTQLAVIFSTFGRNCDTLSISSQNWTLNIQSSNSRGRGGKIALSLLEVTHQSVWLWDSRLHSRQFHDNFGFNKDFLSHRKWWASGGGN